MYNNTLRLHGENHTERSAFSVKSIILFCNCNLYFCDMLPPLKSQILKWGLLAQWLY